MPMNDAQSQSQVCRRIRRELRAIMRATQRATQTPYFNALQKLEANLRVQAVQREGPHRQHERQ
eukprot:8839805-Pyramimonas_sp.AAC.1